MTEVYVLELDGHPRLIGVRVVKFLQVMADERVKIMRPDLTAKSVSWTGETEDGRLVTLRPIREEDIT